MDYEALAAKFAQILAEAKDAQDAFGVEVSHAELVREMLEEVRKEEKEAAELRSHGW